MRIAIFTNNYLPNPYGVTGSVESFRDGLEKAGHTVFIFAPSWKNYTDTHERVYRYPSIETAFKFRFPLSVPFSPETTKVLRSLDIDVIHSQHPNLLGSAAYHWARIKGVPLIFTWHTLYNHYVHYAPVIVPRKLALLYVLKNAVGYANKADHVVVPTPSVRPLVQQWGVTNENITAVPTGVREAEFTGADGAALRARHGITKDATVLLSTARLSEEKNISFLFDAALRVLTDNPRAVFVVVSGGNLESAMKRKAARAKVLHRVIFVGQVERTELKDYYAVADIFVSASKSETQGMAIMEAMAMRLPVVSVDGPGVRDLIEHNTTGFLVGQRRDVFVRTVQKLIDDKHLRTKIGDAAAHVVSEQFSSEACTQKLLAVYKDAIAQHHTTHTSH